jgi:hypothetical protein
MSKGKVFFWALILTGATVAVKQYPDIARYRRIRDM